MKIYLLSYSTPNFRLSQILLGFTAKIFGCQYVVAKKQSELIKTQFYKENETILTQKRGAGFWLWKYYFIDELMDKIDPNDIIIYSDSALFFRRSIKPLIEILINKTNGVLLFYNDYKNKQWTKRDCFVKLDCDSEAYYNSPQIGAQFQVFQKNAFTARFVKEVLKNSCLDNIITDSPNVLGKPNLSEFVEHRHDQSITSLMAHKHEIALYPDPSQFKTKDVIYQFPIEKSLSESLYKNIIYVHRFSGFKFLNKPH
jgi:hypothetical protein